MKKLLNALKSRAALLTACAIIAALAACSGGSPATAATQSAQAANPAPEETPAIAEEWEPPGAAEPDRIAAAPGVAGAEAEEGGGAHDGAAATGLLHGYGAAAAALLREAGVPAPTVAGETEPSHDPPAVGEVMEAGSHSVYVAPSGNDKNPGTSAEPFRTLARAIRAVRPGTVVLVAPGTYSGGVRNNTDGSANARISFVSTTKWGARIVPPADSRNKVAFDNRGDYVDVIGFEIDGAGHQSGTRWTWGIYNGGSHSSIQNNHVHHIGQLAKCSGAGGAAIGIDSYYRGVQSHVISNLVHDIGPAQCHFIHGIYVSTSGSVKNNVIYRVSEAGIHLWHDARHVAIANNTVTDSNTGIIVGGGNFYHATGPNDHTYVFSNIVYDNKMGISEQGKTGRNNSYRHNLVYRNSRYNWSLKNGLTHTGTVSSEPLFVSESDLQPSSSSPAVGRATAEHAPRIDFEGKERTSRTGYDIGALQH